MRVMTVMFKDLNSSIYTCLSIITIGSSKPYLTFLLMGRTRIYKVP